MLIDQPQDFDRTAAPGGVGLRRLGGADRQDRMEEEALALVRDTDGAQPRHGLRAMGEGQVRRILDEQVAARLPQFDLDQGAMTALDRIGGRFGAVEEGVGGIDVVLPREQLGDGASRLLGHRAGDRHDTLSPSGMPQLGLLELGACPVGGGRLMIQRPCEHERPPDEPQ